MVGQVKVVGILMLVDGILICLMGTYQAIQGPLSMALGRGGAGGAGAGGATPVIITVVYLAIGLIVLACGGLNIIGGIRTMSFRNRGLGIVALFLNIPPMITCCCIPTSIGIMIYGLIVMFNADVNRGFRMVRSGATPKEVIGRFNYNPGYGDTRDDYDDSFSERRGWEEERRRRRDEDDFEDDYDRR